MEDVWIFFLEVHFIKFGPLYCRCWHENKRSYMQSSHQNYISRTQIHLQGRYDPSSPTSVQVVYDFPFHSFFYLVVVVVVVGLFVCFFVSSFDWPHVYFGEGDGKQTWAKNVSSSVFASRSLSVYTGTRIVGLEALSSFVSTRRNVRRVTKQHETIQ